MESSILRNTSVRTDLLHQLTSLSWLIEEHLPKLNATLGHKVRQWIVRLEDEFGAHTEQSIEAFLKLEVNPLLLTSYRFDSKQLAAIDNYLTHTTREGGVFHANHRKYEATLSLVTNTMMSILDKRQTEIQRYFPHYYERFKTDGIEHNLYIGNSISQKGGFFLKDLHRLRLWELLVTAEIEIAHYQLKPTLPYPVNVRSLLLVLNSTISIRFRMDEKHFDIDGSFSVRYELIKKRIDKAHIHGTDRRVTQPGTIVVIYSSEDEEQEYLGYFSILQQAKILGAHVQQLQIEELAGVSGLKALRVPIVYDQPSRLDHTTSYHAFYEPLQD